MGSFKLTLEYTGGGFAGWARQPGVRTVEGELGLALEGIFGRRISVVVAGRTDVGVHARGQVASFRAPSRIRSAVLLKRLNAVLPRDMVVVGAEEVPESFSARHDALLRTYRYTVAVAPHRSPFERDRALWWPHSLDVETLRKAATLVVGRHDFRAFTPTETNHSRFERHVRSCCWRTADSMGCQGDLSGIVELWISADSFLRHMVRTLVGTMLEVGGARLNIDDFERLLGGAERCAAGPTAKPHGLCLMSVQY